MELPYKISFIVLWVTYILIRVPFDKMHKQGTILKRSHVKREKISIILLSVGLVLVPLLWITTPVLDGFAMNFGDELRVGGICLAVLSLIFFRWVHAALGSNWSPVLEIKKDQQLIRSGPYKYLRHPMYTQIWIWTIAQALIVSNQIAGLSGVVAWAIVYYTRIRNEERMMIEHFGQAYLDYMKTTGRVMPKIFW